MPDWLFEGLSRVLFKLPCCPSNNHGVKTFIYRIKAFIGGKIMLKVLSPTINIKSLFPLKDIHLAKFIKDIVLVN